MKKKWVFGFITLVLALIVFAAARVLDVDPYFHFHAPDTLRYYYRLDNQRSQNDGITRNFEYEGLITGTSMVENTSASEAEALFGVPFVKVCYEGGTFNEINANLAVAARSHPELKYVIRGLDMDMFFDDKDQWRTDLGEYPWYLYDQNPLNDVAYLFNQDVLFSRIPTMEKERKDPDFTGGITSFDEYSNWMGDGYSFGTHSVFYGGGLAETERMVPAELTQEEAERIRENIRQNVTALALQNPQITFYVFIAPYSAAWWQAMLAAGELEKRTDAEKIVIEEILACENIRLFSFNTFFDITTNLNHFKDMNHYGEWINSLILRCMRTEKGRLTRDNYEEYLAEEREFYGNYDYSLLLTQEDYEADGQAAELTRELSKKFLTETDTGTCERRRNAAGEIRGENAGKAR